ncbi:S-layer homology domain-containing protein [Paenibacillus silviterrae]|uniref:S-layer homology domain-containing protein n=1 Tax=Paenibacillus silviterrae TaxID=3242194 RepID=UPI00254302C4|nr:S-layer homology domain-containing protein [Paenibacillus chinjuensis]
MSTKLRNSVKTRAVAMLMSFLMIMASLMPFAAGSRSAYAEPTPYTPLPEVSPAYTGPLTWMNHTAPLMAPGQPPVMGNYTIPFFMDMDDNNTIYVTKFGGTLGSSGKVEKISSDGQTVTDITYNAAVIFPIGIAVDQHGNVYVADNSKSTSNSAGPNTARILKLPYGTNFWENITYGQSMNYAYGVAVDKYGNVYAVDGKLNTDSMATPHIIKLPAGGTSWVNISGNPSPFVYPVDIAVDGEGNVFVSDLTNTNVNNNTKIFKLPFGETTWTNIAPTSPAGAMPFIAYGIHVDKFDNLYTMSIGISKAMKLKYNGGTNDWKEVPAMTLTSSMSYDVAADSSGYLYATNLGLGNITKLMASVIYNGSGNTGGTVPNDTAGYGPNVVATVYGNTGNLVKTGHVFGGWSTSPNVTEATYAAGDTINMTQSVTLYAVWKPLMTVTYNGNGNTGGSMPVDANEYTQGQTATVLGNTGNLVKAGYVFEGWSTSPNVTEATYAAGDTINMTQSVTLYAVWKPLMTVTYNGNGNTGGSMPVDANEYTQGQTATVLGNTGNLVKAGYVFDGWGTAPNATEASHTAGGTINMTQSVTLYAVWKAIPSYTVSYQAATGGSINGSGSENVYSGHSPASVPTATPDPGYTFLGWSNDGGTTLLTDAQLASIIVTSNSTYTAYFKPPVTLSSLALDSVNYSLSTGTTHQTVVTAIYSDQTTSAVSSGVSYSSSNAAVATVNNTGLVTAVSSGQTIITAEFGGKQAKVTVTVEESSSDSSPGSPGVISGSPSGTNNNSKPGVEVIVDGVKQDQLATVQQDTMNGRTVATVVLDSQKVIDKLKQENNKLLTIPLSGDSQIVVGQLNGSLVKAMESNQAQIQIVTEKATYTLPASQINIDSISAQVGAGVKLEDITVRIQISETSGDKAAQVQTAAQRNQFEVVVQPVDFEISASYGSQTVQANQFNSYVGRMIALPDGVNSQNITTGVVLSANGELFHVPTIVVQQNGKPYALINSLTNSTYSVIYNPREMNDVKGHWANADVNDMTSRLIIQGVSSTEFRPNAPITRAEFAAIVTRGLGIQGAPYAGTFTDVSANSWYAGAVQAAVNYKLIDGYENGTFRPDQNISRQEATAVLSRAAAIAKLKSELSSDEVDRLLSAFADGSDVASWAQTNVAAAISLNLMNGRGDKLDLEATLTRAETAALVRRFLQAAKLINQ